MPVSQTGVVITILTRDDGVLVDAFDHAGYTALHVAAAAAEPTSGLAAEDIFRHLLAQSLLPSDDAPAVEYPSHAAVEYPSHAASVDPTAASVVPPGASESVAPTQASGPTAVQTAVKDVTPQPVAVEVRESVAELATPGKRDSAQKNIFAAFWDFFKP